MTEPRSAVMTCVQCRLQLEEYEAQRCSRCKAAIYCGAACQRAHWKVHKPQCNSSVALQPVSATFSSLDVIANAAQAIEAADTTQPQIVITDGAQSTLEQCLETIRRNPQDGSAWFNLGKALNDKDTVTIDDADYTQQKCFLKALYCDRQHTMAWNLLGDTMSITETDIEVHGSKYTQRQCYLEALRFDLADTYAWNCLGVTLEDEETVCVAGKDYGPLDCYLEALRWDPDNFYGWYNSQHVDGEW